MGLGPVDACRQVLARANMTIDDIDLVEINEAFAAQVIPSAKHLGISWDKLNVKGGAIALGHPFGQTGARIMTTLLNALEDTGKTFGLESMCVGGGQGMAMIVERAELNDGRRTVDEGLTDSPTSGRRSTAAVDRYDSKDTAACASSTAGTGPGSTPSRGQVQRDELAEERQVEEAGQVVVALAPHLEDVGHDLVGGRPHRGEEPAARGPRRRGAAAPATSSGG